MIVTVETSAHPPRVKVETMWSFVFRTVNGVTVPVRGALVDGVVYDYEAPQGVPLTYTDGFDEVVAVLPDTGNWLVHLTKPELSVPLTVNLTDSVESASTVKSLPLLGRAPHTVATGRTTQSTAMTVHTFTRDEAVSLAALLKDESVLWLSTLPRMGWGPWYVRALETSEARTAERTDYENRAVSLPLLIQDRPVVVDADLTLWEQMPTKWYAEMPTTWAGMPG